MIGIDLATFSDTLHRVPVHIDYQPHRSFDLESALGPVAVAESSNYSGTTLVEKARNLGMDHLGNLSVDQLFKLRRASIVMMPQSVEDAIKKQPHLRVVHKIENSMWRWGMGRTGWNEIVNAYDGIRQFSFHPDFEVRLDHTTSYNPRGSSEYSRTFLDGVFGFLIYYRGQHVMTLGFSIMSGRRLLIQQVQLKNRRGNRWLFKLASNYVEYALSRFQQSFPRHRLYLIDGGDNIRTSIDSYRSGLKDAEDRLKRATRNQAAAFFSDDLHDLAIKRAFEDKMFFEHKIGHASQQVERVAAIYSNTGRFTQGKALTVNKLKHYALAA